MSPKERTSFHTLIILVLALVGFAWAFGLTGCATPGQPVTIPAPPLVRY
jgi:hypothetical protein